MDFFLSIGGLEWDVDKLHSVAFISGSINEQKSRKRALSSDQRPIWSSILGHTVAHQIVLGIHTSRAWLSRSLSIWWQAGL